MLSGVPIAAATCSGVEVLPDASPGAAMANGDAVASDSRIEITLSNGLSLCVSGAFDPDVVLRLVRGLVS